MKATDFLNQLKSLSPQELQEVKGLGPILAQNLVDFASSDRFNRLYKGFSDLQDKGLGIDILEVSGGVKTDSKLAGKKIVITGTFDIGRDEIKLELEKLGAKVSSQVSSNTDLVLAGDKAGSKLQKAIDLGVKVVYSFEELVALGDS